MKCLSNFNIHKMRMSQSVLNPNRYTNEIINALDTISYILYYPWTTCFSFIITCYVSALREKKEPHRKILDYFLFGPMCAALLFILLPLGLMGIILWIVLCSTCFQEKYSYVSKTNCTRRLSSRSLIECKQEEFINIYSFCSANILLGPECLNHLNNNTSSYIRAPKIAQQITSQSQEPLTNFEKSFNLCDSVITYIPNIDFLCLQEVWERYHAKVLIKHLKQIYPYILYDIGEYKWNVNCCLFGSGLMFASKKPILCADFRTFSFRTQHAKCATQGILCVKVLLNAKEDGSCDVGYIANLHTQAFQGTEPCIYMQLSESLEFMNQFKKSSYVPDHNLVFDVVCADVDIQAHTIFSLYQDPCCKTQGEDYPWAIGTELRQAMLYAPQLSSPEQFRKVLINNSLRRKFVLDADVLIHSHELMTSVVNPGEDGRIPVKPYGGMRRVDRLLFRSPNPKVSCKLAGYAFSTALTNMTDHLPVCMSITTQHLR
ncbi:hypothetical protein B566_EDAN000657 [Ephemera danica]|nr:hypothetical protein B566_EDAN000657 [Ephemera danica]